VGASHLLQRVVPAARWLPAYQKGDLRPDLVAGLTVGAMLVPQAMAYAALAGLPPQVGLYSAIVPLLAYAVFGTSRQLAVGPVAVVSLLTASALSSIAEQGTPAYLQAAAMLALLVGAFNVVLGLARMGWVTNLLSHPVLVGYTAAAALIIGASQLKSLLGVSIPRTDLVHDTLYELGKVIGDTSGLTLAIGLVAVAALVLLKRWKRAFPGALVVVVVGTAASVAFDFASRGVKTVGTIPEGLPTFAMPEVSSGDFTTLLPVALTITIVGYLESIAVAKVYARRNRYEIEPNQELVGLGAANVAAGVFGGQPVTGGFSRTAVNATAGARTPLASVVTALIIAVTVAFLTPLFEDLPQAILAAIVLAAVASLFDVAEMRHIASVKRADAWMMGVAFVATLALGVETGILAAVGVSIAVLVARIMNPHSAELGRLPGSTTYRNVTRFPEAVQFEGVGILRIDVSLNYINVTFLKKRLRALEAAHPEGLRAIVLDGSGVNDLDASAEAALAELVQEYGERGIEIHLADMKGPVRDVLVRSGLWAALGDRVHTDVHSAVDSITGVPRPAGSTNRRLVGIDERG
jgi:sulfate permease, SulP family